MSVLEAPLKFFEGFGTNIAKLLLLVGIALFIFAFQFISVEPGSVFSYMIMTAPLYLPFVTFHIFYDQWLYFVQKEFNLKQGRVSLEIKLPQDIFRSPEAMELVLVQLHQAAGPDNHVQTYWDGKNPPTYALEIVSRGGDVRFYVNTPRKKFKNMWETQLYAQYPGIEITELDVDYTSEIVWDPDKYDSFSFHFNAKKADAYPIKTYIDFGLDKMPKEEEKTDPITSIIEALGSAGLGEHLWIQILITANREENFKTGSLHKTPDWKVAAEKEILAVLEKASKRMGIDPAKKPEDKSKLSMMNLTDSEKQIVASIERSIAKSGFNTRIRGMYIAEKQAFNGDRIGALSGCWRTFDDGLRNVIAVRWRTDTDWPWWQDRKKATTTAMKKQELNEYKRRSFTKQNAGDGPKVFTTEELATIFHLPGKVAFTPTLQRIPSKRSEAPGNLPIG